MLTQIARLSKIQGRSAVLAFCLLVLASGLISCTKQRPGGSTTGGASPLSLTLAELEPDALPAKEAQMVLQSLEMPVELLQEREGNTVKLILKSTGAVFEEEVYESTDESFSLIYAAGETFNPPLPLLRSPLKDGDSWKWKGTMESGGIEREATATINTMQDTIAEVEKTHEAVKTDVRLEIQGGGPTPAKRVLAFWFVQGRGVLAREFGVASKREPLSPPEPEESEEETE